MSFVRSRMSCDAQSFQVYISVLSVALWVSVWLVAYLRHEEELMTFSAYLATDELVRILYAQFTMIYLVIIVLLIPIILVEDDVENNWGICLGWVAMILSLLKGLALILILAFPVTEDEVGHFVVVGVAFASAYVEAWILFYRRLRHFRAPHANRSLRRFTRSWMVINFIYLLVLTGVAVAFLVTVDDARAVLEMVLIGLILFESIFFLQREGGIALVYAPRPYQKVPERVPS